AATTRCSGTSVQRRSVPCARRTILSAFRSAAVDLRGPGARCSIGSAGAPWQKAQPRRAAHAATKRIFINGGVGGRRTTRTSAKAPVHAGRREIFAGQRPAASMFGKPEQSRQAPLKASWVSPASRAQRGRGGGVEREWLGFGARIRGIVPRIRMQEKQ